MPKGDSGRLVIEVEPYLKRRLYSALAADSTTLKAWFIAAATEFLKQHEQPRVANELKKTQSRRQRR